jgi:ABC-2 type transport system ATP-binding protein
VPRRRVAVCPDVPEFDGWLTAFEIVDLARSFTASGHDAAAVLGALRIAGLADSASGRAGGFSRGMTQRLGLACALVGDPALLILDEPASALDPAGRAEVLALVARLRGRCTVIFSSHILADVQRVADHVGILRAGRMLHQGPVRDLIDTYLQPRWLLRVAGDVAPALAAIRAQPWATRTEHTGAGELRIDAVSLDAGERGIPAALASCGARQVSCEPLAAERLAAGEAADDPFTTRDRPRGGLPVLRPARAGHRQVPARNRQPRPVRRADHRRPPHCKRRHRQLHQPGQPDRPGRGRRDRCGRLHLRRPPRAVHLPAHSRRQHMAAHRPPLRGQRRRRGRRLHPGNAGRLVRDSAAPWLTARRGHAAGLLWSRASGSASASRESSSR